MSTSLLSSSLDVPSGSPENRTRHHVVISRVWTTSPRLPFVLRHIHQSGWQDSNLRSRAPRARGSAATLHPASQSERPDLNRRSPAPQAGAIPRLRYVLPPVAPTTAARRCPESNPPRCLEGAESSPIDERAVLARGLCAVGREVLEPSSPGLQPGATPSQLPAQQKNPASLVTPGSCVPAGLRPSVTSAKDARAGYSPVDRHNALCILVRLLYLT